MKTVIHTTIDGFDIVLGFSDPQMDPVATAAKVDPLVQALPEIGQARTLGQQIADAQSAMAYAAQQLAQARAQNNQIAIASQTQAFTNASSDLDTYQAQLRPVLSAIDDKKRLLMSANPVWFTPGSAVGPDGGTVYESLMPETDVEYNDGKTGHITATSLKAAMTGTPNQQLCIDGSIVADYRNVTVWSVAGSTWTKRIISALGDKPASGEIVDENLTDSQRSAIGAQLEAARVAGLTAAQKLSEATAQQQEAKSVVAQVQSEMTAGISTQAQLDTAVADYKTVLAGINAKYGTSLM